MLKNIPSADGLNEMSLRIYFDAWQRLVELYMDFEQTYPIESFGELLDWEDEWNEYTKEAQPELGAICVSLQHAVELRLKSIIADVSPYLLLLNGGIPSGEDVDFNDLRTLDAVDLPKAVKTFSPFEISDVYIQQYSDLRKLRNKYTHLGIHSDALTIKGVADVFGQQYLTLWPDGRWLALRRKFDGNSAKRFFHDGRYSSVESYLMYELPYAIEIFDNAAFKKCFGHKKSAIVGHCPECNDQRASKGDAGAHPTAVQKSSKLAVCLMCEVELKLTKSKACADCDGGLNAKYSGDGYGSDLCFFCGA